MISLILPEHLYNTKLFWSEYHDLPNGGWVNASVIDLQLPIRMWLSNRCYGLEKSYVDLDNGNRRLALQLNFKKEEDALLFKLTWM